MDTEEEMLRDIDREAAKIEFEEWKEKEGPNWYDKLVSNL